MVMGDPNASPTDAAQIETVVIGGDGAPAAAGAKPVRKQFIKAASLLHMAKQSPDVAEKVRLIKNRATTAMKMVYDAILPLDVRWKIILEVASGIEYIHSMNVIHRDLKSLNILLSESFDAKICDFGLTKIIDNHNRSSMFPDDDEDGDREFLDKTHLSIDMAKNEEVGNGGSPRYMAPELFFLNANANQRGGGSGQKNLNNRLGQNSGNDVSKVISKRLDIWAFGCLVNEIFSGQLPFQECFTMQHILTRIYKFEHAQLHPYVYDGILNGGKGSSCSDVFGSSANSGMNSHAQQQQAGGVEDKKSKALVDQVVKKCMNFDSKQRPKAEVVLRKLREINESM